MHLSLSASALRGGSPGIGSGDEEAEMPAHPVAAGDIAVIPDEAVLPGGSLHITENGLADEKVDLAPVTHKIIVAGASIAQGDSVVVILDGNPYSLTNISDGAERPHFTMMPLYNFLPSSPAQDDENISE